MSNTIKKKTVGLYLDEKTISDLQKLSHIKSLEKGVTISYLDLIRECISKMIDEGKKK